MTFVAAASLSACVHLAPAPRATPLRPGSAADVGAHLDNYSRVTIPSDGVIVVAGDGFVASGAPAVKTHKSEPKTVSLADALADATQLKTLNQTRPGDTIAAGGLRLATEPAGNLLVICYGYGDAAAKTPVAQFQSALEQMIRQAHNRGAAVYVVTEPATTLPNSLAAEPYRNVARLVSATEGAGVMDAPPALASATLGPSKTRAQPAAAVRLIAGLVSQYIMIAPPARPS